MDVDHCLTSVSVTETLQGRSWRYSKIKWSSHIPFILNIPKHPSNHLKSVGGIGSQPGLPTWNSSEVIRFEAHYAVVDVAFAAYRLSLVPPTQPCLGQWETVGKPRCDRLNLVGSLYSFGYIRVISWPRFLWPPGSQKCDSTFLALQFGPAVMERNS